MVIVIRRAPRRPPVATDRRARRPGQREAVDRLAVGVDRADHARPADAEGAVADAAAPGQRAVDALHPVGGVTERQPRVVRQPRGTPSVNTAATRPFRNETAAPAGSRSARVRVEPRRRGADGAARVGGAPAGTFTRSAVSPSRTPPRLWPGASTPLRRQRWAWLSPDGAAARGAASARPSVSTGRRIRGPGRKGPGPVGLSPRYAFSTARTRAGVIGIVRIRLPVASKNAFAIAAGPARSPARPRRSSGRSGRFEHAVT